MSNQRKLSLVALGVLLAGLVGWVARKGAIERAARPVEDPALSAVAFDPPLEEAAVGLDVRTDERIPALINGPDVEKAWFGQVLDSGGDPIPGALVELRDRAHGQDAREPLAAGVSDGEGRFRIPAKPVRDSRMVASATAPGFRPAAVHDVVPRRAIVLRMRREVELFGRVLDAETREPLSDARVSYDPQHSTHSDAGGHYRLSGLGADLLLHLQVAREDYAERGFDVRIGRSSSQELDLLLERGVPIVVSVFDVGTGVPVVGAEIRRLESEDPYARSDENGRFILRVAPGSEVSARVSTEQHCVLWWTWDRVSVSDLHPAEGIRIPMRRPAWVEGRVTDAGGAPIWGCSLSATRGEHWFGQLPLTADERRACGLPGSAFFDLSDGDSVRSDADGRYALPVIPNAEPQVVHFGHREFVGEESRPLLLDVPGARVTLDMVLSKGGTISGRAVLNGEPWQGAVHFERDGQLVDVAHVVEDGKFGFRNLRPGPGVLSARGPDGRGPECIVTIAEGEERVCDLIWEEARETISGCVTRADGMPLQGVAIQAGRGGEDGGYVCFDAKTADDGTYAVEVAPGPPYDVRAGSRIVQRSREYVAPGATGVDFVLPEAGLLRLQLVDATTGAPAQLSKSRPWRVSWREVGMEVYRSDSRLPHGAGPDVEGRLELELPVVPVDLRLAFYEDGYRRKDLWDVPVSSDVDAAPIEVALERGVELVLSLKASETGAALDHAGHLFFVLEHDAADSVRGPFPTQGGPSNYRVNGQNVWLSDQGLLNRQVGLDQVGGSVVRGLVPGRYLVRVLPDDLVLEPAEFEVGAERTVVEFTWRPR